MIDPRIKDNPLVLLAGLAGGLVRRVRDYQRIRRIKRRIKSGYYDSPFATEIMAQRLLDDINRT